MSIETYKSLVTSVVWLATVGCLVTATWFEGPSEPPPFLMTILFASGGLLTALLLRWMIKDDFNLADKPWFAQPKGMFTLLWAVLLVHAPIATLALIIGGNNYFRTSPPWAFLGFQLLWIAVIESLPPHPGAAKPPRASDGRSSTNGSTPHETWALPGEDQPILPTRLDQSQGRQRRH